MRGNYQNTKTAFNSSWRKTKLPKAKKASRKKYPLEFAVTYTLTKKTQ